MMRHPGRLRLGLAWLCFSAALSGRAALDTASNTFQVTLAPPAQPRALLQASPFGINTDFHPDAPDLEARLTALQDLGVKWGRQDFTWKRIERRKGEYHPVRTKSLPVPLGESPVYVVGPKGLKATVRPDPGW